MPGSHRSIGQGQSHITEDKLRGFASVLRQNVMAVKGRGIYFHFDLHGGSGWNHDVNVVGSPVLFQQIVREHGGEFVMHAAELDKHRAASLADTLRDDECCFVRHGDNAELVTEIPHIIRAYGENPRFAFGSVLIDPNNPTGGIPWAELECLFAQCNRLDVIFNFPSNAMKRIRKARETTGGCSDCIKSPSSLRIAWNKAYGQIRKPLGPHQFTLLVFRNTKWKNGHRSIHLVDIDSREGCRLLDVAEYTTSERSTQERMLFDGIL